MSEYLGNADTLGETDRQTDGWTYGHTDRQAGMQADRHTERQTGKITKQRQGIVIINLTGYSESDVSSIESREITALGC